MKYKLFITLILFQWAVLSYLVLDGILSLSSYKSEIAANKKIVRYFMFTDLALWTEAPYTRHPSQTDLFSPFQDFPGAIEHFPSGSIIAPPRISHKSQLEP